MPITFRGGIHPDDNKKHTSHKPIEALPAPVKITLPMSMHIGAPCEPIVSVGDYVKMGQKIADSEAFVSAPIHSSVSGKVIAIEPVEIMTGLKSMAVIIENDFEDTPCEDLKPLNIAELTNEQILQRVLDCGVVGLGGAAFPTHIKLKSGLSKVSKLIINGAECEPYITSDHRLLLENSKEIIGGIGILKKFFNLKEATLAIEANKSDAIMHVRKLLKAKEKTDSKIHIKILKTKYPQGAEKQLIKVVCGREVPPGGLPADVSCAVFNVDTTAAIYRAVALGKPVIQRVITVSGPAVANPKNLSVRCGTPLEDIFAYVGGFREEAKKIIAGGPMMGVAISNLSVPVTKATNSLLGFLGDEFEYVKNPVCINCGKCLRVCPMRLAPMHIAKYCIYDKLDEAEKINIKDCIECGCCSYECPERIPLVQIFRAAKMRINEKGQRR